MRVARQSDSYDVEDRHYQQLIKTMLPTASQTKHLPFGFELVQEAVVGKTKSQSSGSRNQTLSSDDFSPSSAQGESTA